MILTLREAQILRDLANQGKVTIGQTFPPRSLHRTLRKLEEEVRVLEARDRLSEAQMELRAALHQLWLEAGEPSTRKMARDMGKAHMTWHYALKCDPVPSLSTFRMLVQYLDGDMVRMEELWFRAKGKVSVS